MTSTAATTTKKDNNKILNTLPHKGRTESTRREMQKNMSTTIDQAT